MAISTYQANRILNYYYGSRSSGNTPDPFFYVGFSTSNSIIPGWNGTTLMAHEPRPVGADPETNYARVEVPNTNEYWSLSTSNSLHNLGYIISPEAFVNWGNIWSFFIADSSINGNLLYYKILSSPINVDAGESIMIRPTDLVVEVG